MARCPACFQNSYPEVPDITINEYIFEYHGNEIAEYVEVFTTASSQYSSTTNIITLSKLPISENHVRLYLNGVYQTPGESYNFYVRGSFIVLQFVPSSSDVITVHYTAYVNVTENDEVPIGTMCSKVLTADMVGKWVAMLNTISLNISDYPVLYEFAKNAGLIDSETATTFNLKTVTNQVILNGVSYQLPMIIRAR